MEVPGEDVKVTKFEAKGRKVPTAYWMTWLENIFMYEIVCVCDDCWSTDGDGGIRNNSGEEECKYFRRDGEEGSCY